MRPSSKIYDEVPAALHPFTPYSFIRTVILEQYKPFCILMETFQELELETVEYMLTICPIRTVGPLSKNPMVAGITIAGDIIRADDDCIEWLDTKPPSSVVYISFGTIGFLKQEQCDEMAYGLMFSELNFLWVMRPPHREFPDMKSFVLPDGFFEKAGDEAKLAQWSPQEQVLSHLSVACFVTHCGWNSSMEALASGIPIVAFPHRVDQAINAKYLVDIFEVGGVAGNKVITVDKCLFEVTVGPKAEEMKQNALKWKAAAQAAVAEAGFSDRNFEDFVEEVKRRSVEITGL